jgi:hypothetical protein
MHALLDEVNVQRRVFTLASGRGRFKLWFTAAPRVPRSLHERHVVMYSVIDLCNVVDSGI